ncbi:hypothetical protein T265_07653 [Opisthorchis viverrini]|uniref:Uncharacterized protein n=1 Tax=Opisthorchis viverrini TaxID=6198 RepID=A0A075AB08_OPIVI|nr:hypothetical protein T265_07653 [Opisthorchis viverrini]KER24769.1 hypothetical protein T265_07653 [Opisthorchis viverrini]
MGKLWLGIALCAVYWMLYNRDCYRPSLDPEHFTDNRTPSRVTSADLKPLSTHLSVVDKSNELRAEEDPPYV